MNVYQWLMMGSGVFYMVVIGYILYDSGILADIVGESVLNWFGDGFREYF